jgi:TrmH family RNA methyltransferase
MKIITSSDNAMFKRFRKLAESSRERRKTGQTLLDGIHLVSAYLGVGAVPEFVLMSTASSENAEIKALLEEIPQERQLLLTPGLFAELSPVETPTGIIAVIGIPHFKPVTNPHFCLFLEDIQDPGNMGSILRSATAAGVQLACLSAGCVDAWSPKVLRGGMGAHFALAIEEGVDLPKKAVMFEGMVVATRMRAARSVYELDLRGQVAFCIGNEGAGVTEALLMAADEQASIPMPGAVESLNAAAAAAVFLFERVRQLRQGMAAAL